MDEGEGDLGKEEVGGSKEIQDEVANITEVQRKRSSKEKTSRCTPKPSTSAALLCLPPPTRPAPDSSSTSRSDESKSSDQPTRLLN